MATERSSLLTLYFPPVPKMCTQGEMCIQGEFLLEKPLAQVWV